MALAVVNTKSTNSIGGSSLASTTLTYNGSVTTGSTLVALGFFYNDTGSLVAPAVSDTVNGAWTTPGYAHASGGFDNNIAIFIAIFPNTVSGTPTVTLDPSGNAFIGGFWIGEVTGAAASSLDVTSAANEQTTSTPFVATGILAQADEVIFAVMSTDFANSNTITPDATYTEAVEQESNAGSQAGSGLYKIVATTASDQADWTSVSADYLSKLITLKSAAAGGDTLMAQSIM